MLTRPRLATIRVAGFAALLSCGTLLAAAVGTPPRAAAQSHGVLAFSDGGAGGRDLWSALPDGSGRRILVSIPAGREAQPTWSPDARFVGFATELPEGQWAIGRAEVATGDIRLLTNGPGDLEPDWSHDGRLLAFSAFAPSVAAVESSSINIVAADGSLRRTLLVLASTTFVVTSPSWSPDGRHIAFVLRSNSQGGEIYVTDANGSNTRRLFSHPGWDDIDPAWGPDGRHIAFASGPHSPGQTADQVQHGIWMADVESGAMGSVFADETLDLRRPTWSPEGLQLAMDGHTPRSSAYQIFTAPATGGLLFGPITTGAEPAWGPSAAPPVTITPGGPSPTASPTSGFPTTTPPGPPTTEPTGEPFPTIPTPEASPTGPAPTFVWPSPTFTPTTTPSPTATPSRTTTPTPTTTPTAPPAVYLPWLTSPGVPE
jgi:Tol biopolymer transport system component